jgi:hypothetical protein
MSTQVFDAIQGRRFGAALLFGLLTLPHQGIAQERPRLHAHHTTDAIHVDGRLDEPAWQLADSIVGLTEYEPGAGVAPRFRTVVKVMVTDHALLVGYIAYDSVGGIVAFSKTRDADLKNEDHVTLVLDTNLDGRSGYVFRINPNGARYDALIIDQGEGENSNWDAIWDAATLRTENGWNTEVSIPIRSLAFRSGLTTWGLNVGRRIIRMQQASRWANADLNYKATHTSRAGLLVDLPHFDTGLGLSVRPSVVSTVGVAAPMAPTNNSADLSLDATKRLGGDMLGVLTVNTDFAETEVDTRRTNLTRFPLFFPEKRAFFLEGSDVYDFGLGMDDDALPFFSRRIGLLSGQPVPILAGGKLRGRTRSTNIGTLVVGTDDVEALTSDARLGVVRIKQDVLRESSVGGIMTFGDPTGRDSAWTVGTDFTYQTTRFHGNRNFLIGAWGLVTQGDGSGNDRTAAGFKIDYPNDIWDVAVKYKRIGADYSPRLGFVPRPAVQLFDGSMTYRKRPHGKSWYRTMVYEFEPQFALALNGDWESYRLFTAPINWRLESGDRVEFNVVPAGERLSAPFEIADGVIISAGEYNWLRYRLEGQLAVKRKLSGQLTWWFGGFYDGNLHEIKAEAVWNPAAIVTFDISAVRNIGHLRAGDFTQQVIGTRARVNFSPDFNVSTFVQYDNQSKSVGANTRIRWTFKPSGDFFLVYNHNVRDYDLGGWTRESYQLIAKIQYAFRY